MTTRTVKVIGGSCGALVSVITLGIFIWQGYNRAPVPDSVEEFHEASHEQDRSERDEVHGMVTALTIGPILDAIEANPCEIRWRNLLEKRKATYLEKTGLNYQHNPLPVCEASDE